MCDCSYFVIDCFLSLWSKLLIMYGSVLEFFLFFILSPRKWVWSTAFLPNLFKLIMIFNLGVKFAGR